MLRYLVKVERPVKGLNLNNTTLFQSFSSKQTGDTVSSLIEKLFYFSAVDNPHGLFGSPFSSYRDSELPSLQILLCRGFVRLSFLLLPSHNAYGSGKVFCLLQFSTISLMLPLYIYAHGEDKSHSSNECHVFIYSKNIC